MLGTKVAKIPTEVMKKPMKKLGGVFGTRPPVVSSSDVSQNQRRTMGSCTFDYGSPAHPFYNYGKFEVLERVDEVLNSENLFTHFSLDKVSCEDSTLWISKTIDLLARKTVDSSSDSDPRNSNTLTALIVTKSELSSFPNLSPFTSMSSLDLSNNQLVDVSPFSGLVSLTWLNLCDNNISNLAPLSQLTQLRNLQIHRNSIADLTPLVSMLDLVQLRIAHNLVTTTVVLPSLTTLDISHNSLVDISSLKHSPQLKELYLCFNQLTDIRSLENLTELKELYLEQNPLNPCNFPVLPTLTSLNELTWRSTPLYELLDGARFEKTTRGMTWTNVKAIQQAIVEYLAANPTLPQ